MQKKKNCARETKHRLILKTDCPWALAQMVDSPSIKKEMQVELMSSISIECMCNYRWKNYWRPNSWDYLSLISFWNWKLEIMTIWWVYQIVSWNYNFSEDWWCQITLYGDYTTFNSKCVYADFDEWLCFRFRNLYCCI